MSFNRGVRHVQGKLSSVRQSKIYEWHFKGKLHSLTKRGWGHYSDLGEVLLKLAQVSYHLRIVLVRILHSRTVSVQYQ